MKKADGSALPTVMVIAVLICLLVLFAIALFENNMLFYHGYHNRVQCKAHLNSAVVLYCNDSTFQKEWGEVQQVLLFEKDASSKVHYLIKHWGLYECVHVDLPTQKMQTTRLLGKQIDCDKQAALWACDQEMALSLGGKSNIRGRIYVPMNGLNYVTIENEPFSGENIDDNNVALSDKQSPLIDSTYLKEMEALKLVNEITDFPPSPEAYYPFNESTIHLRFPQSTNEIRCRGNVVLHGDDVTLSSQTIVSDVILLARKVTVQSGFKGSLQILATDTVIIEDNACLEYPSGICLKGDSTKTFLSLGASSYIKGYAVVFGYADRNFSLTVKKNYSQAPSARFYGLLYVDGITELNGKVSGAVYIKRCYYLPHDGLYSNTLFNTTIYRNNEIAYPFFFKNSPYRRKEIKTLH